MHQPLTLLPLAAAAAATGRYMWVQIREANRQTRLCIARAARAHEDMYWGCYRHTSYLLALQLRARRLGADQLADDIIQTAVDHAQVDDAIDRILGEAL